MAQNAIWSREFQTSIRRYQITRVLTIWHVKPTQSTALEQERFDVRSLSPAFHNLWLLLVCLKSLIKDTNRKKNPLYIIVYWLESAFTYTPIRCHAHFIDQSGQQPEFDTINWRETTHFEDDYRKGCRNVSHCQQHFRITLTRTIISSNYDITSPQTVYYWKRLQVKYLSLQCKDVIWFYWVMKNFYRFPRKFRSLTCGSVMRAFYGPLLFSEGVNGVVAFTVIG